MELSEILFIITLSMFIFCGVFIINHTSIQISFESKKKSLKQLLLSGGKFTAIFLTTLFVLSFISKSIIVYLLIIGGVILFLQSIYSIIKNKEKGIFIKNSLFTLTIENKK